MTYKVYVVYIQNEDMFEAFEDKSLNLHVQVVNYKLNIKTLIRGQVFNFDVYVQIFNS